MNFLCTATWPGLDRFANALGCCIFFIRILVNLAECYSPSKAGTACTRIGERLGCGAVFESVTHAIDRTRFPSQIGLIS